MKGKYVVVMFLLLVLAFLAQLPSLAQEQQPKKLEDIKIRFFVGGDPGDVFASIVYKGAQDAEKALGVKVEYVFSGWNVEKMVSQLRDAIAARPDGIAMMGHPGDEALMPLVEEAMRLGIKMMFQNVDCPKIRERFGNIGYVGADLAKQGWDLGKKAIEMFGLQKGDRVIVFGAWGQPGRYIREEATAKAFEEAGIIVDRITAPPASATSPELLIPPLTGAVLAHPEIKLICLPGGQALAAAPMYMEAIGKKPGEIKIIGFDLNPAVIEAFRKGYVQLTADQQPYLQGYLPVLSLALTIAYGFSPISYDTGAGFVTAENHEAIAPLVEAGIR
ncbi:MAG: substrate-binding domain-containing protein [Candidatus Caldatribacterium sp.]|nr:substrate-binding domain-containing protein [Candidatus Caldatribacterium sp.]